MRNMQPHMTVDRIEGDIAVCEKEDGSRCEIPLDLLSGDVKEGDVLNPDGSINKEETALKKERISALLKRLKKGSLNE